MNGLAWPLRRYVQRIITRRSDPTVTTFRVRLPSELREAQFQATIRMEWPPGRHIDRVLQSVVEQHLLGAARSAAKNYSVLDPHEACAAIDLELFGHLQPEGTDIYPVAASVAEIAADLEDQHLAESQEALRRQTALAQAERTEEVKRLRILGDEILTDPMLARLWWLDGKPDRLEKLVELGNNKVFEDVVGLLSTPAEQLAAEPITELIRIFLQDLDPPYREQLIRQLQFVFRSYERIDLAGKLDSHHHPAVSSSGQQGRIGDFDGRVPAGPDL
jgi:hypothetical protein